MVKLIIKDKISKFTYFFLRSIKIKFNETAQIWRLDYISGNKKDMLIAKVGDTKKYPDTVQWYSYSIEEKDWIKTDLLSVEESNEQEYNKFTSMMIIKNFNKVFDIFG